MGDPNALRNFKDFLQLYNHISEVCFSCCANNFNTREMEPDEISCMELCLNKHVKANNKIMTNFVEVQTQIVNRRVEEMNKVSTTPPPVTPQTETK